MGEAPQLIVLWEGVALPNRYTYAMRTGGTNISMDKERMRNHAETVDLSTPLKGVAHVVERNNETPKSIAHARKNATQNANKKLNTTFAREVKDSLAGGKPPTINGNEDETHLKARWHATTK